MKNGTRRRAREPIKLRLLAAPVGDMHFHGVPTAEAVDDWLEGDGERAVHGHEVVLPVAAAERDATNRDAVLLEAHCEVMPCGADAPRRLGESNIRRAEDRPFVAAAERRELFDLLYGLVR